MQLGGWETANVPGTMIVNDVSSLAMGLGRTAADPSLMNGRMIVSLLEVVSALALNVSVPPCTWEMTRELRGYEVMKTLATILGSKARGQGR